MKIQLTKGLNFYSLMHEPQTSAMQFLLYCLLKNITNFPLWTTFARECRGSLRNHGAEYFQAGMPGVCLY